MFLRKQGYFYFAFILHLSTSSVDVLLVVLFLIICLNKYVSYTTSELTWELLSIIVNSHHYLLRCNVTQAEM